ncbi:sulfite exporter TauE/SafE family protein [Vibrio renipiscarius]|uniref:Probable membrane transporter protein n=1 Tax=Vibrio renipiscarius TaxID=1461322 RepID=A0A0C2NG12_9VIBR|nr:sulfite exporter TauE/SafE family protein [Vibrio renipiscarius]KII75300.1 hypothetical protein OJ16_18575 [Vibrio renipiscarius]KII78752.1 hypothetical protein PL18_10685 [Vibrio renipiscarius]
MFELFIGMLLGLTISMTGVGGGVLMIPVLMYLFKMDPVSSVATANLCSMLMKLSSSATHYHLGNIPIKTSFIFLLTTAPTTIIGSYLISIGMKSNYANNVNIVIEGLILLAMASSLTIMIRNKLSSRTVTKITNDLAQTKPWYQIVFAGLFAGSVIGCTGVGGGIIVLPILIRFLNLNIKQAVGVSVFVTMLLSGFAALVYGLNGQTNVTLSIQLFAGSLIAIPIAHKLMKTISMQRLDNITLSLVILSVGSMCFRYL